MVIVAQYLVDTKTFGKTDYTKAISNKIVLGLTYERKKYLKDSYCFMSIKDVKLFLKFKIW